MELSPPYVSFRTLLNFFDLLSRGVPSQVDRSVMPSFAGAVQNQIMTALKFLKLTNDKGMVHERLRTLAERPERRRELLRTILEERYQRIFALDLTRVSPIQLEEAFRGYGIAGETLSRAVRFFLAAAEFAGVPLSPLLRVRRRMAPRKSRREQIEEAAGGESITVPLKSGGTCTFSTSASFFRMAADDRAFVFDIIDRLQKYGR
jgi:hypothetical protein